MIGITGYGAGNRPLCVSEIYKGDGYKREQEKYQWSLYFDRHDSAGWEMFWYTDRTARALECFDAETGKGCLSENTIFKGMRILLQN